MSIAKGRPGLILIAVLFLAACQAAPTPTAAPPPLPEPTYIFFPSPEPGDGSDLLDRVLAAGVLRVGLRVWPNAAFSPPAFRGGGNAETGGPLQGFEVDLAHMLAERLGVELELIEAPPAVIASGNWQGRWDIALASLVPFDEPSEPLFFSQPYVWMPMGILLPVAGNDVETLAELSGRRVGALEKSPYERLLATQLTAYGQPLLPNIPVDVRVVPLSNLPEAIRQMGSPSEKDNSQVAAIFGPRPILEEAINNGLALKLAPYDPGRQPLAIATVSQDGLKVERLLIEINKILTDLERHGELPELYIRWYGQDLSR
jgi:polar amino acid transport system substrate-binding protein